MHMHVHVHVLGNIEVRATWFRKRFKRKQFWTWQMLSWHLDGGTEERHEEPESGDSLLAETQAKNLANTSL
jgi:hypothetical protein